MLQASLKYPVHPGVHFVLLRDCRYRLYSASRKWSWIVCLRHAFGMNWMSRKCPVLICTVESTVWQLIPEIKSRSCLRRWRIRVPAVSKASIVRTKGCLRNSVVFKLTLQRSVALTKWINIAQSLLDHLQQKSHYLTSRTSRYSRHTVANTSTLSCKFSLVKVTVKLSLSLSLSLSRTNFFDEVGWEMLRTYWVLKWFGP